jgi:uncharacterized membrane protein
MGYILMIKVIGRIRSLDLSILFRWFIIYSIIGWSYETVFTYFMNGVLSKRGFLLGPLCPIYGVSILIMLLICSDKGKSMINLIIKCAFVATTMEYITSYWLERLFDRRWWDYSDMFMNVNGRICLGASILFGVLGAVFVRYIHPGLISLTNHVSSRLMRILDRIVLVLFLYDILLSIRMNVIR